MIAKTGPLDKLCINEIKIRDTEDSRHNQNWQVQTDVVKPEWK